MTTASPINNHSNAADIVSKVKQHAALLGFADCRITGIDNLQQDADYLQKWLAADYHGDMQWMAAHGDKRWRPEQLVPGTIRVLSLRMDYSHDLDSADAVLTNPNKAYISRYALGRDYHKLIRKRLQKLADYLVELTQNTENQNTTSDGADASAGYRVFVDSAPVLEKALARNAGLGWIGKHTLILNRQAGSWFFLGEIYTDWPLPIDPPQTTEHCGSCQKCIDICPTQAIVAPYKLDARRCISYLTIEHKGKIPVELRKPMGNRVFGCDDCQLVCPWNKHAQPSAEADFAARQGLQNPDLPSLFNWTETEFLSRTEGMAIRRTGYLGWLRNLAVALGNAPSQPAVVAALQDRSDFPDANVREHIAWALQQHKAATD